MTKEETQAVKEVLLWMLLQGGNVHNYWLEKEKRNIRHINLLTAGWTRDVGRRYTVTPKGIAFVEQGE